MFAKTHLKPTQRHLPYEIRQCSYLPPDTQLTDPQASRLVLGIKTKSTWVVGYIPRPIASTDRLITTWPRGSNSRPFGRKSDA